MVCARSMFRPLYKAPLLLLLRLIALLVGVSGMRPCPNCGNTSVPYPLSTSSICGHPLYPITCTPHNTLQLHALSFNYTIKYIDAETRTFMMEPAGFLGNSCITQDSSNTSTHFALNRSMPFFLMPNNTIFVLNGSQSLLSSPVLDCAALNPCTKALSVFPQVSCRSLLCCSFSVTSLDVFSYEFPIYGLDSAYASVVNLDNNTEVSSWNFGLQVGWNLPQEPPCTMQSECGDYSTCSPSSNQRKLFCLCNKGYYWDPSSGACVKGPYCEGQSSSVKCNKAYKYALGITVGFLGLSAILILSLCIKCRASQKALEKLVKEREAILAEKSGGKSAHLFSSKEMKAATNNFAEDTFLGCGAFGEVFKGVLQDGTVVAIKAAKIGSSNGTDQILNEVRILSQINHKNLVKLLGCCVESKFPLLVYEYITNGNLYDHIHGLKEGFLDWKTRLCIGLQAAEGLAYLHSATYSPIFHRDVKSSNILLDESMKVRVSDFGISCLADPNSTHISTCAQGTIGYLDPEYYRTLQLTAKSDVYSFGMVLLELVTSKKVIDFQRSEDDVNLASMVWRRVHQGELEDVLDSNLTSGASRAALNSMWRVIGLALDCLKEKRLARPSMEEVADKLQQFTDILEAAEGCPQRNNKSLSLCHHIHR